MITRKETVNVKYMQYLSVDSNKKQRMKIRIVVISISGSNLILYGLCAMILCYVINIHITLKSHRLACYNKLQHNSMRADDL